MSTTTSPSYGQPALIGGLVMGVLSALPLVSFGNTCCCMWMITGGLVAAYILQQNQAAPIAPGDGALVGLLAGLVGAFVHLLLSIPIDILMAPFERAMTERLLEMAGEMPSWLSEMAQRATQQQAEMGLIYVVARRVVLLIFTLFLGAIFSTIGGVLGAAIFRPPPRPNVIDIPPGDIPPVS